MSTAPSRAPEPPPTQGRPKHHGVLPRGLNFIPRSESLEGRFGRMFRTLPAAHHRDADLRALGEAMTAELDFPPTPEDEPDDEENTGISAGYTYFGQFIDHDLTFDPNSSLQKQNDPDALVDYRTPRFDLDNLYGRGPDDQPYLYRNDGLRLLHGTKLTGNQDGSQAFDLPRNQPLDGEPARALIGDPRNDENVIVSQLQGMFIRFHNRVVDFLQAKNGDVTFEEAQRYVRWHYQWVVLHDFLPTIVGDDTVNAILPHIAKNQPLLEAPPDLKFFKPKKEPFIPVEFSVAAYRFGHSMVRPIYRLNAGTDRLTIFSNEPGKSLTGFQAFNSTWAIDWPLFFNFGNPVKSGKARLQPAYKIDTSLVNPLGNLPPSVAKDPSSLPQRNLLRGLSMGLPSGQQVACHMGIKPVPEDKLRIGKATEDGAGTNKALADVFPRFKNNAPLWYYILAEAQQQFVKNDTPIRLGPVGGRIVGEVFVGLMWNDKQSYLRQEPCFEPFPEFLSAAGKFDIAALLTQAAKA